MSPNLTLTKVLAAKLGLELTSIETRNVLNAPVVGFAFEQNNLTLDSSRNEASKLRYGEFSPVSLNERSLRRVDERPENSVDGELDAIRTVTALDMSIPEGWQNATHSGINDPPYRSKLPFTLPGPATTTDPRLWSDTLSRPNKSFADAQV
jgi:hypothetical protein